MVVAIRRRKSGPVAMRPFGGGIALPGMSTAVHPVACRLSVHADKLLEFTVWRGVDHLPFVDWDRVPIFVYDDNVFADRAGVWIPFKRLCRRSNHSTDFSTPHLVKNAL